MFVVTHKHAPYCLRWAVVLRIQPNMAAMAAISKFLSEFLMEGFFELNRRVEFLLRRLLVHAVAKSESARKMGRKNRKKNYRKTAASTTVWKVISARKLFTMFFTSTDHIGNVLQDFNYVWTEEP